MAPPPPLLGLSVVEAPPVPAAPLLLLVPPPLPADTPDEPIPADGGGLTVTVADPDRLIGAADRANIFVIGAPAETTR